MTQEFTDEDRAAMQYWINQIPSDSVHEAIFNSLAYKIKHDLTGPSIAWRGMVDLYDRQQAQIEALVHHAKAQSDSLTRVELTFTRIVQRLDEGLSIVEALEQYDVAQLEATIGKRDADDSRTIIDRLNDQDVDREGLRWALNRLSIGVALFAALVLVWFLMGGAAPPVFGGI